MIPKLDAKHLLKHHAYQNIPLRFDEAYALGLLALEGCAKGNALAQMQSIAILCALHTQATYAWRRVEGCAHADAPESAAEQIAGICAAIFEADIGQSEFGFLKPNVPYAMDNCGMGGDLVVTANVSTLAALIAAAADIPMCKHGSPANADAGHHGSSDFIELLGIDTYADKHVVEGAVEQESFGYTEALHTKYKRIHLQTHTVAQLPHMNDIIGPITNPLHPFLMERRVLGVNHLVSPRVVAEAYVLLNKKHITKLRHGLFVRGFTKPDHAAGMDEVSICEGGTLVAELRNGRIHEYRIDASTFGIDAVPAESISPPSGMSKGEFSLGILSGRITGPPLQMVFANAAILFYLAGRATDLKECYAMAEETYRSGAVRRKVAAIQQLMPKR